MQALEDRFGWWLIHEFYDSDFFDNQVAMTDVEVVNQFIGYFWCFSVKQRTRSTTLASLNSMVLA
jgi:hypothetical protein